jgi:hypothetical protein
VPASIKLLNNVWHVLLFIYLFISHCWISNCWNKFHCLYMCSIDK